VSSSTTKSTDHWLGGNGGTKLHPRCWRSFTSHPSILALEVGDVLLQAFEERKDAVALAPAVLLGLGLLPPTKEEEGGVPPPMILLLLLLLGQGRFDNLQQQKKGRNSS